MPSLNSDRQTDTVSREKTFTFFAVSEPSVKVFPAKLRSAMRTLRVCGLSLPDLTLKYREVSGDKRINDLCIGISKLSNNCINVVGGMRIIIHVQQWL